MFHMPVYQFNLPRLFINAPLTEGAKIELDKDQSNYLGNVLRAKHGFELLVFNGSDGEWLAKVEADDETKRRPKLALKLSEQTRQQHAPNKLRYLFSPIKQARQDYMVQKAVEMGVSEIVPVRTDHCQVSRVNVERLNANAIEACEQCGVLNPPICYELISLLEVPEIASGEGQLVFCDESASKLDPSDALNTLNKDEMISVLIGPEGGFSASERQMLQGLENVTVIGLGPRILRADTAAVAALTAVQMVLGDWT